MAQSLNPPPKRNDGLECPYDKVHIILPEHFQVHLVKCRRSAKNVKKVSCPFNATHLINEPEMNWHVSVCPDKGMFDKYKYTVDTGCSSGQNDQNVPPTQFERVETTENWDDEDVPTYNPNKYASTAPVLRLKAHALPSHKKQFRVDERKRLQNLNNE